MSSNLKTIPTMADIARLAGVHVSTVSRALADSPLVEKGMREHIMTIAREQGYVVNSAARNLRAGRTQTLSVAIPLAHERSQVLTDPFFTCMLSHLADEITRRGYDMHLKKVLPPMEGWLKTLIAERRADGIIVIGQSTEQDVLNEAAATGAAVIVWGGQLPDTSYCVVGSDNTGGSNKATRHLLNAGKRNIVFVGDPAIPEISLRCEGYRQALAEENLLPTVVKSHMTADAAYQAVAEFITGNQPFDAIFAATDIIAISAIRALRDAGLSVPGDVAVIGFDGMDLGAHMHPALTTMQQNLAKGAEVLVDHLLRKINGETVLSVMLPTELVIRESCGTSLAEKKPD